MAPSETPTSSEPERVAALGINRIGGRLVLEDDVHDRVRTLIINQQQPVVLDQLRASPRYLHEVGHHVETDVTIQPPGEVPVTTSVWPTSEPTAHPDRDFDDYFVSPDDDPDPRRPQYTSLVFHPYLKDRADRVQQGIEYIMQILRPGPVEGEIDPREKPPES